MNEYKKIKIPIKRPYPYYDDIENQLFKLKLITKALKREYSEEYIDATKDIIKININTQTENVNNNENSANDNLNNSFNSNYSSISKFSNKNEDEYLYILEQETLFNIIEYKNKRKKYKNDKTSINNKIRF